MVETIALPQLSGNSLPAARTLNLTLSEHWLKLVIIFMLFSVSLPFILYCSVLLYAWSVNLCMHGRTEWGSSLDPRPSFRFYNGRRTTVVCLTVIKAKTRPGIEASGVPKGHVLLEQNRPGKARMHSNECDLEAMHKIYK